MQTARELVTETPALDTLLACQPVLTRNRDVAAFDLIIQPGQAGTPLAMEHIQAALPVVLDTYARIFQHGGVVSVPSFLKVPQELLFDARLPELPGKQLTLAVEAGETIAPGLAEHLTALAAAGHHLALHGYDPDREDLAPLVRAVHIVRLDLESLSDEALRGAVAQLRPQGVDLLAHGIDSQDRFRECIELGFTYFQGTFLSEVTPVRGKKIGGNKYLLLELLSRLQNPDATAASLEELAIRDPNLTFRILRIVNSAAHGARREIDTLSQAITLLGTDEIRRWVNLFLVEAEPGKPEELTRGALVRARMCEILAELDNQPLPVNHFIVGLLSQLDVLMDINMEELVEQLPLRQEAKVALLERKGSQGEILAEVEHYERGHFDRLSTRLEPAIYEAAYRHACAWARQVQFDMST